MLNVLIIDDQPSSHINLKTLFSQSDFQIQIQGSAYNVADGLLLIQEHNPDLVFLDIEMPDGTGFDLMRQIPSPDFQVIFITAFNQYAQTAIRLGALDYITKPIDSEELENALLRAKSKRLEKTQLQQFDILNETLALLRNEQKLPSRIAISTNEGVSFFPTDSIMYLKAMQNYTQFFFKDGTKVLASLNLKKFENDLKPYNDFMRVHKSYIIQLKEVVRFIKGDKYYVEMTDSSIVPVSKSKQNAVMNRLTTIV